MNLSFLLLLAVPALDMPGLPDGDCFTAGFVQVRELPMLQRPLTLQGQLKIERDGDLEWRIIEPYPYRFSVHGGTFTETLPDGSVRAIDAGKAPWLAGMQQVFGALLSGGTGAIDDWFKVVRIESAGDEQRVTLAPSSAAIASVVTSLVIGYGEYLNNVTIMESGGGSTEIRFEPLLACMKGSSQ